MPRVRLELEAAAGYAGSWDQRPEIETDPAGLAVVNGITSPLLRAKADHPDFVATTYPGLTASPGTFAFEEVVLREGGVVRVEVSQDGEPVSDAACEIKQPFRPARYDDVDTSPPVFQGLTDDQGVCRARIAEGEYILGVEPSDAPRQARWAAWMEAVEGQESRVDVALTPIKVAGEVLRGSEPAPSYTVLIAEAGGPGKRWGPPLGKVSTNEEGHYETMIWQEAEYAVHLLDPKGFPADMKITRLEPPETAVDFLLAESEVVGFVVDDEGMPVPEASVSLRWPEEGRDDYRLTITDKSGYFSYSVDQNTGPAVLEAARSGYAGDRMTLQIQSGIAPPPVELVLKKLDVIAGTVRAANGMGLPGAQVAVYSKTPGLDSMPVGMTVTDDQGNFELSRGNLNATEIFATGPGCPLTLFEPARPNLDPSALEIHCAPLPAALRLTLRREDDTPLQGAFVYLRHGRQVVPRQVLRAHQQSLGLSATTDGSGRLTLVGLTPGTYDLYYGGVTNTAGILSGRPEGHLASPRIQPLETKELEITVRLETH